MPGVESEKVDELPPEPPKPVDAAAPPPPPPAEHTTATAAQSAEGGSGEGGQGGLFGVIGKVARAVAETLPGDISKITAGIGGVMHGAAGPLGNLVDRLKDGLDAPPGTGEMVDVPPDSSPAAPTPDNWATKFAQAEAEGARAEAAEAQAMDHLASPRREDQLRGQAELRKLQDRMKAQTEALKTQDERAKETIRDVK